jgi:LmbE family N-acetylglucosaminyl deacetylase
MREGNNMLKSFLVLLTTIALVFSSFTITDSQIKKIKKPKAEIVNPNENSNVVFYIPHQDDEALTFGVGIMNHVMNGHNVHVVLMTDGSASNVRTSLGLTEALFTQARNREFNYSMMIMGVKPQNISYRNIKDGTLTVANSETIMKEYEAKYPNAKHKTFSWTDPHTDHANLGVALKNLNTAGVIADARFYVRRGDNPVGLILTTESFQEYYRPFLLAVSASYNMENTRLGYYAIGHKSVPASFDSFEEQPLSRYHK